MSADFSIKAFSKLLFCRWKYERRMNVKSKVIDKRWRKMSLLKIPNLALARRLSENEFTPNKNFLTESYAYRFTI
ncbi:MAG TPA: hypothetical protein DD412_05535, partial [Holosporales bacterium]|nr:hypothetical protein [Holosporales bacterium]